MHIVDNLPLQFPTKWQWLRYTGPATVFSHQEVMNVFIGDQLPYEHSCKGEFSTSMNTHAKHMTTGPPKVLPKKLEKCPRKIFFEDPELI